MCDYFQEWIINSSASLRSFLSSGFVTFYGRSFYDLYTNFYVTIHIMPPFLKPCFLATAAQALILIVAMSFTGP